MSPAARVPAPAPLLLYGLCPLLAPAHTLLTGLAMGLLAATVLGAVTLVLRWCRNLVAAPLAAALALLLTASCVSALDLLLQSLLFPLRAALGIYLPLIAGNALILSLLDEQFAQSAREAWRRALRNAGAMLVLATACGALRELAGAGRLLTDTAVLQGLPAAAATGGLALAATAAGTLFALALLAALLQYGAARSSPA